MDLAGDFSEEDHDQTLDEFVHGFPLLGTSDMLPIGAFVVSWTPEGWTGGSGEWCCLTARDVPEEISWLWIVVRCSRILGLRFLYRHADETIIRVWRSRARILHSKQLGHELNSGLQKLMSSLDLSSKTWAPELVNAWIPQCGPFVMPCDHADVVVRDISQFQGLPSEFYMSTAERHIYCSISMNRISGLRLTLSPRQIATVQELLLQENFPTILYKPPMFPIDGPTGETLCISREHPENTLLYWQDKKAKHDVTTTDPMLSRSIMDEYKWLSYSVIMIPQSL